MLAVDGESGLRRLQSSLKRASRAGKSAVLALVRGMEMDRQIRRNVVAAGPVAMKGQQQKQLKVDPTADAEELDSTTLECEAPLWSENRAWLM